ncbi:unnamed protein product [Orchesella dallaii]
MEDLKQTIIEAIVAPQRVKMHADLTLQAILVAGPPGCAKTTVLEQAAVLSARALKKPISYFKVTYSDALSSFVGESEKFIKVLFETAQEYTPSIILMDEVDGFMKKRQDHDSDHSSRFKSALLSQIQGYSNNPGVVLLATTNLPNTMDEGYQRRFQERYLVRLPSMQERVIIFDFFVGLCEETVSVDWDSFNFQLLAENSQRFSGDDIRNVIARALRKKFASNAGLNLKGQRNALNMSDISRVLKTSKPTCKAEDIRKLEKWGERMATNYSKSNQTPRSSKSKLRKFFMCMVVSCCCCNAFGAR